MQILLAKRLTVLQKICAISKSLTCIGKTMRVLVKLAIFALALAINGVVEMPLSIEPALAVDLEVGTSLARGRLFARAKKEPRPLKLVNEYYYYKATLGIGSPPQNVSFTLDTGSSDLWVISTENPLCSSSQDVEFQTVSIDCTGFVFDETASSTYNGTDKDFEIWYLDQTGAKGVWGFDNFVIGNAKISHAQFGLAKFANSSQAVLGLSFPAQEVTVKGLANGIPTPTYPNLPMLMKSQGLIHTISYSLWLNDPSANEGALLFGGIDHSKYHGNLMILPIIRHRNEIKNPSNVVVHMDGLWAISPNASDADVLNDSNSCLIANFSIPVLLDSGTTLSYLPEPILDALAKAMGYKYDSSKDFYYGDCDIPGVRNFVLDFQGAHFPISMDDSIVPISQYSDETYDNWGTLNKTSQCTLLVSIALDGQDAIIGDTWLRSFYVVYDLEHFEVGIARAKMNVTENRYEAIKSRIPGVEAPKYSSTSYNMSNIVTYPTSWVLSTTLIPQASDTNTIGTKHKSKSDARKSRLAQITQSVSGRDKDLNQFLENNQRRALKAHKEGTTSGIVNAAPRAHWLKSTLFLVLLAYAA